MKNKSEKRKGDEVKSRGRGIQKRRVIREIYSEVVIWVGCVRCGSHLRMKVRGVGSVMHRV